MASHGSVLALSSDDTNSLEGKADAAGIVRFWGHFVGSLQQFALC